MARMPAGIGDNMCAKWLNPSIAHHLRSRSEQGFSGQFRIA